MPAEGLKVATDPWWILISCQALNSLMIREFKPQDAKLRITRMFVAHKKIHVQNVQRLYKREIYETLQSEMKCLCARCLFRTARRTSAEQGDCIRLGSCLSKGHPSRVKDIWDILPLYPGLGIFCASNAPICLILPHPWHRSPWTFSAVEHTNLPSCPKLSTWILFLRGVAWQSSPIANIVICFIPIGRLPDTASNLSGSDCMTMCNLM